MANSRRRHEDHISPLHRHRLFRRADADREPAWLARTDRDGTLPAFLKPDLSPAERAVAQVEGWILGVR